MPRITTITTTWKRKRGEERGNARKCSSERQRHRKYTQLEVGNYYVTMTSMNIGSYKWIIIAQPHCPDTACIWLVPKENRRKVLKRTVLAKQIINRLNIDKYTNHEWNALFYTRRFFILNGFELLVVCLQVS